MMTGMEGLLSADVISIIDGAANSRQVTRHLRAKIKEGVYNVVTSIFCGSFQLPLSFQTVPLALFRLGLTSYHVNICTHLYRINPEHG